MTPEPLDLYARASQWTLDKVAGAAGQLDARTPCDEWTVRDLMRHMLDTQRHFVGTANGQQVPPPSATPTATLDPDPARQFDAARAEMLRAYGAPDVIDRTGPSLGIAFADQLLHGWDLATATGQDATMPDDLAATAYDTIHGKFTDEQRKGVFKPEVELGPGASAQDRLLAYTGRAPGAGQHS